VAAETVEQANEGDGPRKVTDPRPFRDMTVRKSRARKREPDRIFQKSPRVGQRNRVRLLSNHCGG